MVVALERVLVVVLTTTIVVMVVSTVGVHVIDVGVGAAHAEALVSGRTS